jgi:hypothetical protein
MLETLRTKGVRVLEVLAGADTWWSVNTIVNELAGNNLQRLAMVGKIW